MAGLRKAVRPKQGEWALQPTWFIHGFAVILVLALVLLLYGAFYEIRADQLVPLYGLLAADAIATVLWMGFFYFRTVYWKDDGVGVRGPFARTKFIEWREVIWAGRTWSGDLQIRAKNTKITYVEMMGGHRQLTDFIKLKLPQFEKNFP